MLGADFSAVQLHRAQRLVRAARLVQADIAKFALQPATVAAGVSFYALIHVPVADQRALFPRIRDWLRPGRYFLAIVGAEQWTGIEHYLGADMFWDHADTATYLDWLTAAHLTGLASLHPRRRLRAQPHPRPRRGMCAHSGKTPVRINIQARSIVPWMAILAGTLAT